MNRRREPCRNFQRGSCQFGDRCKFLHVTEQQPKPSPFGFGTQSSSQLLHTSQHQKPNPFGFGVPNSSQSKGAPNFSASIQSPAKPFENKWIRSPANSTLSQQTDTQPQAVVHNCTDPESCKRQIAEDFKNEAPLWKLTCYGHFKYLPCDIVGDISFEELRAAAYEDCRKGLNLQSIVERERNLLNAKLIEFDNLLRNPYVSWKPSSAGTSVFPKTRNSSSLPASQTNAPPSFSSFSQLGASSNFGSGIRSHSEVTPSGTVFGQPKLVPNINQTSGEISMNFGMPVFGSQPPIRPSGSSPSPGISSLSNGVMANGNKGFSFLHNPQQFRSSTSQISSFHDGPKVAPNTVHEASIGGDQDDSSDHGIWLKEEWHIGEIPEEEPPRRYC